MNRARLALILITALAIAVLPALAAPLRGVDDAYTVSLLHMNGADASTTFVDESGKTWTAYGDAQIDTAQSVFGGASGLFDGTGDYIDTPDSADFEFGSGEFTLDAWVRFPATPTTLMTLAQKGVAGSGTFSWLWRYRADLGYMEFMSSSTGSTVAVDTQATWAGSANTWYHLAAVRTGTTIKMFVDGSQIGTDATDGTTFYDGNGALAIGARPDGAANYYTGWIDEFRVSKGIARWTDTFTPPDAPYPDTNATATAAQATADYWANQTATQNAANATATYWANATGTAEQATADYWANATGTAEQATADYWTNATGTAAWLTANPPDLTATYEAQQTQTAAALTAIYSVGTPAFVSVISYGDMAQLNLIACLIILVALIGSILLILRLFHPEGKGR